MNVPLNIDWQQILLHLLNFVVLFAILYFLLYSPVKRFMDKRQAHYKKLAEDAEENLQQSEELKKQYADKLQAAEAEIEEKQKAAYQAITEKNEKALLKAKEEAEQIVLDAHKKAENEHGQILENARKEIAEMVVEATEKMAVHATTPEAYDSFLNSVKERGADE